MIGLLAAILLHPGFYPSMDEAARAALADAYICGGQRRECGGVIYEELEQGTNRHRYAYTVPGTSDKPFGVETPELAQEPPQGMTLAGDYHNHICSIHNKAFAAFFSYADAQVEDGFHVIGYMLDGCTGLVHRYDPSQDDRDDEEVDFVSGKKIYLTIGHISGWIDLDAIQRPREKTAVHQRVEQEKFSQARGKSQGVAGEKPGKSP